MIRDKKEEELIAKKGKDQSLLKINTKKLKLERSRRHRSLKTILPELH